MNDFKFRIFAIIQILYISVSLINSENISKEFVKEKFTEDNDLLKDQSNIILEENQLIDNDINVSLIKQNNSSLVSYENLIYKNLSIKNDTIINLNSSEISNFDVKLVQHPEIKYHSFEVNTLNSFLRSFSLLLVSEVMDKTFLIILYFSTKLPFGKLLFFSGVSLLFMNCISIVLGYSLPFLLYRSLIEWIALISFIFLSFAYVYEAYYLDDDTHEQKINKRIKSERRSLILEKRNSLNNLKNSIILERSKTLESNIEMRNTFLDKNRDEENAPIINTEINNDFRGHDENQIFQVEDDRNLDIDEKKKIYTLMYTIIVAECGDRSQISSVLLATVYDISGVMLGTTTALLCTIFLAVFYGSKISKYISEKYLNYIAGIIFLLFGFEILLTKIGYFS